MHLGCFHIISIINMAAVNSGMYMSFQINRGFFLPDIYTKVELLDHWYFTFYFLKETPYHIPWCLTILFLFFYSQNFITFIVLQ